MIARTAGRYTAVILASSLVALKAAPREVRADFLKMIDRPHVPLAPEVKDMPETDGLYQLHFSFAAEEGERVPGVLIRQASNGRKPVVIALHGTGGKKESQIALLKVLSEKGFVAVAIDGRHYGERTRAGSGSAEYNEAILRAYNPAE